MDAEDGRTFDAHVVVIATAGIPAGALPEMPAPVVEVALIVERACGASHRGDQVHVPTGDSFATRAWSA